MKRPHLYIATVFFLAAGLAGMRFAAGEVSKRPSDPLQKEIDLYREAFDFVRKEHVKVTDAKDLVYASIGGMLGHLDPYSAFLTPEEHAELRIGIVGHFAGVGVEVAVRQGLITVIAPIEGTSAWQVGVLSGDKIVKIDDVVVKGFSLGEVVKRLRGRAGTWVKVSVWREQDDALHEFKLKRSEVVIQDIRDQKIITPGIGYMRIVEFQEKTPQNLDKAIEGLKRQGASSLIIDLRNNPGGLLEKAIEASQRFLEKGSLIVTVQGRDPSKKESFVSTFRQPDVKTPLVLLINGGSASGSEIMAGALRQHGRALLVGSRSFGKGAVQTVQPLRDGSALMLTTATYVLPNGIFLEESGIAPDIQAEEAGGQVEAGGQPPDIQLDRAVDLLRRSRVPVET